MGAPAEGTADAPEQGIKRINIAVNEGMLAAITQVINSEGVSLTEAVRMLVCVGGFVHKVLKLDGSELLVHTPDEGTVHHVRLLEWAGADDIERR